MKILKRIFLAILILIGLFLIAAAFMKKEYAIEKEVTINQSKDSVFNYVKMMKNQNIFSVWNRRDPNSKRIYKGTDGEVGFIYSWNGNDEVGEGEQEIKKIVNGERIDFELRFKRPFEANDNGYFITESLSPNQTKVIWGFSGKMPYPMNAMMPLMGMEEMLGADLQKGLNDLKIVLEK